MPKPELAPNPPELFALQLPVPDDYGPTMRYYVARAAVEDFNHQLEDRALILRTRPLLTLARIDTLPGEAAFAWRVSAYVRSLADLPPTKPRP